MKQSQAKEQSQVGNSSSISPQSSTSGLNSTNNQGSNQAAQRALYTVQRNDSLWKIAAKHLGDGQRYMEIARLNGMSDPNRLSVGQILKLPQTAGTPAKAKSEPAASAQSANKAPDPIEEIKQLPSADRARTLCYADPILDSLFRQERKRSQDLLQQLISGKIQEKAPVADPVPEKEAPARNLLMEAVQKYAKDHPKRDGESWNGWCASLMFRFGKSTSGFKDGRNDAPSAIKASKRSNIESKDASKAPKGAFHWWDIGVHGHVGLDVSGGGTQVFMATKKLQQFFGDKGNAIGLTSVSAYTKASNAKYLGWSRDYVGGAVEDELLKEAPASAPKPRN